ncbi:MAG TPA: YihY/virulence factor BrkB family protein [Microthrixaceae bacterium]|nr:YihY/virulence factor BrkB family protein [Microthrixaceae bacterium]
MQPQPEPDRPQHVAVEIPERADNRWNRLWDRIDAVQRGFSPLALAFAVQKKYDDDRTGPHCALISYYSFFAVFPLLLVLFTVLGFFLDDNPDLRDRIVDSVLSKFPVVGDQIEDNVGSLRGSGVAFVFGVLLAVWAGLGATHAAQDAVNSVFGVPFLQRQNFWIRQLRGLATLLTLGAVVLVGTILGSGTNWVEVGGPFGRVAYWFVTFVVNAASVFVLFNILCHEPLPWRRVRWGAVFGGAGWTVLQYVGVLYVGRVVQGASRTYGFFAVVIGLLSWIFLQARIFLTAAQLTNVVEQRLWPRALVREHPTEADVRVADLVAARDARMRESERAWRLGRADPYS